VTTAREVEVYKMRDIAALDVKGFILLFSSLDTQKYPSRQGLTSEH